jgi:hypothetical protein
MCESDNITGYTVVMFVSFTHNTTNATIRAENIDPSGAQRFDRDILHLKRCKSQCIFIFILLYLLTQL